MHGGGFLFINDELSSVNGINQTDGLLEPFSFRVPKQAGTGISNPNGVIEVFSLNSNGLHAYAPLLYFANAA